MPEGRRWGVDNPSPAMKSFTKYIQDKEGADFITEAQVASTFIHHREWQAGHASELVSERAEAAKLREEEKAKKAKEREEKKAEKDAEKAKKEQEREAKKAEKEAAKAANTGADGDDSDSAASENGEPAKTRRRLRTKDEGEPVAAGVSEASF